VLKKYYQLVKPERTYANVITAAAGFLLASKWHIHFLLLVATLVGTSLIVASACVLNNFIDRNIDTKMARTKKRSLATGQINARSALIYASVLGVIGFLLLALYVNSLVVLLGAIAYIDYIILYGVSKRTTVHGTLVGTISGAMPIAAGYCAVTGRIDTGAVILFLAMTFWQMPHFYAIAIYRLKDYKAAKIPVMPAVRGIHTTKVQIMLYTVAFAIAALMLTIFGYTGVVYAVVMALLGVVWLWRGFRGFNIDDDAIWARKMFLFSLKVLLVFALMVSIGGKLP
jgi:heme o synthase